MKTFKAISAKEKEFQNKLNEMGQYYGKEINDLRTKLNEANQSVEKYKETKISIQENLKKALMRGVVAMNFEAMNVLEDNQMNDFTYSGNNIVEQSNILNNNNNNNKITSNSATNIAQEKLERKVVGKDSNWINACSVPLKLKANIIGKDQYEESNENEEEFYEEKLKQIPNIQKQIPNIENNRQLEINYKGGYYEELTKSINNIFNVRLIKYKK